MQGPADKPGVTPPEPPANSQEPADRSPARILQSVVAKLHEGQPNEAVRLFMEGHNARIFPRGPGLAQWIVSTIGKQEAARLISACAHFPCLYCKQGLDSCDACGGSGVRPEGPFCDSCAGLGKSGCDFCEGTGLATYSFFPTELWLPILLDRVNLAIHQLQVLTSQPMPRFSEAGAERNLTQLLLNLNKLMGVLDNAVLAARQIQHHDEHAAVIARAIQSSNRAAAAGIQYMRLALRSLAAAIRHAASHSQQSPAEAQFSQSRAEYFEQLARSQSFEGTGLHHPFLGGEARS